ncbi:MAG: sigma-70 family RNA polymerase sigma factor [Gemmatimonadetes bacterium]|nr:sigma-70 family RNA polymerase sigma factor [Gemmatimonadota bacterium]
MHAPHSVTQLLLEWRSGDERALDSLIPLVYEELRRLAGRHLDRERSGHTLQPTALVHEAYARLVDADISWQDRTHFFAVASGTMRRVLVDHARSRAAARRGGGVTRVTIDDRVPAEVSDPTEILALDAALEKLAAVDSRKAEAIQLHVFGGLTYSELAATLGVSEATVDRDMRMARAFLHAELGPRRPDGDDPAPIRTTQ